MVSTDADDQQLVEAAREGDRRAFQELYRRYERRVYAVAYGFLRNPEDALDIVQEAFIKVHRYLPKFEGQSSFYTWLYRITANLCIDHTRRRKRKRDVEYDDRLRHDPNADSGAPIAGKVAGDAVSAVTDREIRKAFLESLEELSDKHRAVIVMREVQGLSYAEMADAMECSKGTIMSRLFHARRNMQKALQARGVSRPDAGVQSSESSGAHASPSPEAATP